MTMAISLPGQSSELTNFKAARRSRAMHATLFHGSTDDLGKERFGNETCFRMPAGRGGKWAAVAANEVFAPALVQGCRSTQVF